MKGAAISKNALGRALRIAAIVFLAVAIVAVMAFLLLVLPAGTGGGVTN